VAVWVIVGYPYLRVRMPGRVCSEAGPSEKIVSEARSNRSPMSESIVILSSRRLFAEGLAWLLSQYLDAPTVRFVDPRDPDPMEAIGLAHPSTVILDSTDGRVSSVCPMQDLLQKYPDVQVIRLDPDRQQAVVVTSQAYPAHAVRDLAAIISPSLSG
jgi:hypothetical protein